jgi:DNA repair exonuclease SbcCD ATPase subunit
MRYLDRQNHSVNLAREYGKRLKEEIAAFAEGKAAEVKDNGLVLDVQKSAAKEAINRLNEANAELMAKTESLFQRLEEVSRIGDRISAYDKSMEELIRMTARVEENMKRLREESAFVEQTGRTIGEIKNEFGVLEKDIGSLELRFERENTAVLEKTAEALISQVRTNIEDLQAATETVERQVEDHREAVDRIEAERKSRLARDVEIINKTLQDAIERAGLRSDKLEEATLVKLREEAMLRVRSFQDTVEEKFREYHENAKTRVAEIQALVKAYKEDWKQDHAELELKQREYKAEWRRDHEELEAKQKEYQLSWQRDHEELEAKQKEYQLSWQRDLEAMDALALSQRKQWEAAVQETEDRLTHLGNELDGRIAETEERILREIDQRLTGYREDQGRQWERFESMADDALKLDGQLRISMEDAQAQVRRDFALFEEDQKQEREKAATVFKESADALKAEMDALEQELNALKNRACENVSEKIKIFEDDFFADLARRGSEIDSRLNDWHSKLDQKLDALSEEAEAERRSLELSYREELNKRIDDQGEKMLSDLERLQMKTGAFEEKMQNSMDGIESRLSQLSTNAEEIRRELKEFSSQSKLFEKTDELKTNLERSMEALKSDLAGIEERRAEAAQLETEFIKIRRLEDDVNNKMTRFLSEKNHLDIMEKDFDRLIQTSQRVEERLKEVTGADDTLQGIQVSLRKLEDAIVAADDKFQRIEKKNQVLEETNSSIERNFKLLEETEAAIRKCNEDIDKAEEELDSFRPEIEELAAAHEKARMTAEKLGILDTSLTTIENRIEKMQGVREWLARTETRFEEINRQTQDQLKLLEAVLKEDGKNTKAGKGAPPTAVRENVIRLARQGWGMDEIANSLKVSRGEVELILEMIRKD